MNFLNQIKRWRLGLFYSALAFGVWDAQGVQTIQVGTARQVPPTMIGANTVPRDQIANQSNPWADPQSLADLVKTGMSLMRYPGGTYGNYFDWNLGCPCDKTNGTYHYLPEQTKPATDALDMKVVWMANVLMEPQADIVTAMSNAVAQGCEIKYVELGNEFYFSNFDPSSSSYDATFLGNGWTNGTAYGKDMNGWIATLKAKFPDARISLPFFAGPSKSSPPRRAQWNAQVAAACTNYDAITIHFYPDTLIDLGYGDSTNVSEQTAQWNYFTTDTNAIRLVMGSPRQGWSDTTNDSGFWIPTNKPIWFTEFGAGPTTEPEVFKGTWADGLVNFVFYNTLLSHPQAQLFTEQQYIDLNFGGPNEFSAVKINVGQNLSGTLGTLTAEGHVHRALNSVARDKEIVSILSFGGAYTVSPPGIASYPALCGMMYSDATSANAIIANISDQPQEISTASLGSAGADVTLMSADHFYTFVVTSNDVHYTNFTMGATIALPPFTLCTVKGLNRTLATGGEKYTPKFSGTHVPVYASGDMACTRPIARDVTDQNAGDVLSYSLSGTNPAWVTAAGTNGLHFDPAPIGSYKAYVRVVDSSGLSDYATLDITVIDGSANSDGDAYSNDEELLLGTNPLLTDTDGDGYADSDDAYPLDPTRHAVFQQVTIAQTGAVFSSSTSGTTVTVGTFTAQTNDVLVLVAGGSNTNHINAGAVAWVSANGGVVNASTLYGRGSAGIWYTKVTAGGTFNVNFTTTNNLTTVGAYLLHATAGKALKIGTNSVYLAGAATSTNAALTYNFGTASEGIVIECMSTYSSGGATPNYVTADYSNGVPMKRIAGSGTFSNLPALSTSWTVVQTPTNGNVNVAGIVVYTDYVVPVTSSISATASAPTGNGSGTNGLTAYAQRTRMTLTEIPSGGTAPFTFAWKKVGSGTVLGTNSTLTISPLVNGDQYVCDVASTSDGVTNTSPAATLTVTTALNSNKVVIIKGDDVRVSNLYSPAWTNFIVASSNLGVKISLGIIATNITDATASAWLRTNDATGEVEFWDHGWDHIQWTVVNGSTTTTVTEFEGSGLAYMRQHLADAQSNLLASLGKNAIAFGTPGNGFDTNTATVINETPALRLFFTRDSSARSLVNSNVVLVDIIPENGGTGHPDAVLFKAAYPNGPTGPVSLQHHPASFDSTGITQYTAVVEFLLTNGYAFLTPSEYVAAFAPNIAPNVSLTAPTNNASFTAPASLTMTASASDTDGTITSVDFYNGTTLLGSDTSAPFAYIWTNVAAGSYGLTARATDNDGAVSTSAVVAVTVNSTYMLTVNSGSGSGLYLSGQQVVITASNLLGKTFARWTGDTQVLAGAATIASNTVIMSTNNVNLTATYTDAEQYTTNGTPYSWLAGYGLTNYAADADLDQDADGLKTWQEYIAGTDPTNAASVLKAAQATRNVIAWNPVIGRVYSVYWSTNLVQGFTALNTNIVYPQSSYTNATPDSRVNHYQVRVRIQ